MNWKKQFDEKFKPLGMIKRGEKLLAYSIDSEDAKAFISNLLDQQREECPICGEKATKKEILKCIDKMIESCLIKQREEMVKKVRWNMKDLKEQRKWDKNNIFKYGNLGHTTELTKEEKTLFKQPLSLWEKNELEFYNSLLREMEGNLTKKELWEQVKAFIRQALSQQKEEIGGMIEKKRMPESDREKWLIKIYNSAIDDILSALKGGGKK
jgi:polyhydroxyalkanoate synthesis regulator phasin